MTVFALFECWQYEGEELLRLYATHESAEIALNMFEKSSSATYEIREMKVHP